MASAHSPQASPAVHRRGRPGPAVDVIAVVLAARSPPPIRPPPTLVSCQCGQPASWAALRRTDRPRLARGFYQSTARDSVLALPSDILSDALDHPDDHPDDRSGSF